MKKLLLILLLIPVLSKAQLQNQSDWSASTGASALLNKPVGYTILLASAASISGATLASTNLTFASGVALSTHSPTFCIVKYVSGTLGIGVIRIKTGTSYLVAVTAMLGVTTTDNNLIIPLSGAVTNSGSITAEITTASLGASAIGVYVYGILKP